MSTPQGLAGTTIFAWVDPQGLQATLYNPAQPWQTWNPADTQKQIGTASLMSLQVAMDTVGDALFVLQAPSSYCQLAQYPATEAWNDWKPASTIIVQDKTIINDVAMSASQIGIVQLTSLETFRLDTLYVAESDSTGLIGMPLAITRTCIPSSQKMIAVKPASTSVSAMVVWPSTPASGISYIVSQS